MRFKWLEIHDILVKLFLSLIFKIKNHAKLKSIKLVNLMLFL